MAIAIRGTTPADTGNVTSDPISVSLTGARQPQNGDKLLIFHNNDFYASSAMATPTVNGSTTGVTAITNGTADPGTDFTHVKSYFYDVTSTGDITVQVDETGPADEEKGLTVYVLSGAATGQPASAAASNSTSGQPSHVVTGVTASASDDWLFIHIATNGNCTWTPPSSPYVEDIDTGAATGAHSTGHEPLSASGPTGTRTFTPSASVAWSAVAVAIQVGGGAAATSPAILFRPGKTWRRRFKHLQRLALDPTVPPGPDADPTQGGYSLAWRWYRTPVQPQQRQLESVPGMLDTALLENELLGSATTWEQYNRAATHVDRREVPQQRIPYASPSGLLDTAELENELLGGATTRLRANVPATHVDRREYPQQRELESSYGLLDQALLEVPPPLPWWYDEAAYLRTPWLRIKQVQADQSSAAVADFDPTQAGYSLRHVWRRDLYPPTQRPGIQNPDDVTTVGTGATGGWWGVDDSAHHFAQWLPGASDPNLLIPPGTPADPTQAGYGPRWMWYRAPVLPVQRQLESDPSLLVTALLENELLGGYGPRWMWYRAPVLPVQRELESDPSLLLTALLEVVPPLGVSPTATHQRLPWLRTKQVQYDQSVPPVITDLDPTQSGGYGPEWHWWYRAPVAPVQRDRESDPNLLLTALLENELLGGADDLVRHRAWFARPWFGLQRPAVIDQSSPNIIFDPTLAGLGPEWRRWYRAPVAPVQRELESDPNLLNTALLEDPLVVGYGPRWMWYRAPVAPVQRERESDPNLLLQALLEDALLGGWDDIQRHRIWYVSRRLYPQQREYKQEPPVPADPLLVSGAEWRYRLIPVTHKARWVLRQWWEQQASQADPFRLFDGVLTGGIRSGPGVGGSTLTSYG